MSKFKQSENRLVIKGDWIFILIFLGTVVMAWFGFSGVYDSYPFFEEHTKFDVFGFCFICFWTLIILWMCFYSFKEAVKTVILDDKGITKKVLFSRSFIAWSDVKDFGLSYSGRDRGGANIYYLYFSKKELRVKNECRKRLRGKMIKCYVMGNDYFRAVETVIPFCCERTDVVPFVGVDKFHLI